MYAAGTAAHLFSPLLRVRLTYTGECGRISVRISDVGQTRAYNDYLSTYGNVSLRFYAI